MKLLFSHWFILHSTPGEYIHAVILCSQLRQPRLKDAKCFVQKHNRGRVRNYAFISSWVYSASALGKAPCSMVHRGGYWICGLSLAGNCSPLRQEVVCELHLQEFSRQQGAWFRGREGESPEITKTWFEALERGVEFWQLEAEGGGNDVDMKVGIFKIYWRMFDYSGAVMEKGLESGKKQILQDAECPAKYINFNLWKMGTELISDFSYSLIILTCTEGYA